MKFYAVFYIEWQEWEFSIKTLERIFSSEEKAKEFVDASSCNCIIEEWEVE